MSEKLCRGPHFPAQHPLLGSSQPPGTPPPGDPMPLASAGACPRGHTPTHIYIIKNNEKFKKQGNCSQGA